MFKTKKLFLTAILGIMTAVLLCFGVVFSMPTKQASAATTLSTENWTLAVEGTSEFRVQNGTTYWTANTNDVTTASMLDYTEINGKTLTEINAEKPGAVKVTLQPAADPIGSFYRIIIDTEVAGFTVQTIEKFEVKAGWSHTDTSGTYTLNDKIEFVKSGSSFVRVVSTVDISNAFKLLVTDNGTGSNGTACYYIHTNGTMYWTAQYGMTGGYAINESEWKGVSDVSLQGGAIQMSYLAVNGTSIYDINVSDNNSYGSTQDAIAQGGKYAPILALLTCDNESNLGNIIKLQIPSAYPSGSGAAADNHKSIAIKKGFFVVDTSTNIKYEVTRDVQWDYVNGAWVEHTQEIKTNVTHATMFAESDTSKFVGVALEGSDYASAPNTYAGTVQTALSYAQKADFCSHILLDDVKLATPGEAFLNVWNNYGYFTFRPSNNNATKITVLAGCQFPTYDALLTGAKEVYVTTEDVTFVKGSDGTWAIQEKVTAGEYATSVTDVVYARDNANNWMMFTLSNKDYPNALETCNIATTEEQISALNLYDKITVDGYTLRTRIATYGATGEVPKINLWQADCFGLRVSGAEGALDGAQKVTVKAGAQFPSYAYVTEGVEAYYVTTEEFVFVNVGASNGAWQRQYTATFVVDGEVLEKVPYVVSQGLTAPAVPEKEGYRGAWESYTANGNITVNAVYTETFEYEETRVSSFKWDGDGNSYVTFYLTNGENVAKMYGDNTSYDLSIYNLWDEILVTATDGNQYTLREVYVGDGGDSWYISFGNKPSFLLKLASNYQKNATNPITEVFIPKGTEFPSFDDYGTKAYVTTADTLCEYNADTAAWTCTVTEESSTQLPTGFDDHYVLSDLHNVAYKETDGFKDGIETLTYTDGGEADYHYGYVDSQSFTLSFDFKYTGANYYNAFVVNLGMNGYGGIKTGFGWRIYLIRGDATNGTAQNQCVQFFSGVCDKNTYADGNIAAPALNGSAFVQGQVYNVVIGYKLVDENTVTTTVLFNGVHVASETYTMGGTFSTYSSNLDSITFTAEAGFGGTVTISDPDKDMDAATYKLTMENGVKAESVYASTYELPALDPVEYGQEGKVFVGWTTDASFAAGYKMYPAGYALELTADTSLYPVWIGFNMKDGAAVRTVENESGIRFTVFVEGGVYDAGVSLGLIKEIGTIVAPTDYLSKQALTHALGTGNYIQRVTDKWQDDVSATRRYTAAFINISYDQYGRAFSARGYMKIAYTSGDGYIYTAYDEQNHSRSIYEVATEAVKDVYANNAVVEAYVNSVADITVNSSLAVVKTSSAQGEYTIGYEKLNRTLTVTVDSNVKAALINGTRVVMGQEARIMIDNTEYTISGYTLTTNGLTLTFTVGEGVEMTAEDYIAQLQAYIDRKDYTETHHNYVNNIATAAITAIKNSTEGWQTTYADTMAELATVKTAVELKANDTSDTALSAPVLSKAEGYNVSWTAVDGADYYTVHDDNDYRDYTVVLANESLKYEAEVIGNHNVYVVAHSYYEAYNSAESNTVATPEVKPVFSYKGMSDGLYKFSSSQMNTVIGSGNWSKTTNNGLDGGYYYDSSDELYFAYYNKDTGWSPYKAKATDWTSPAEFPAHAANLKAMGNNVILIAQDSEASFKEGEVWETSRMKYVMDTAWTMGMKVLVCDEVFYKLSMSDKTEGYAESPTDVTNAIAARGENFTSYITHPAFYGFSLDDEPYNCNLNAMKYTVEALYAACQEEKVEPFFLACLFQYQGGKISLDGSTEMYTTKNSLRDYYNNWLGITGVNNNLYVDIYTKHAMGQPTDRYNNSFDVVYNSSYVNAIGNNVKFYQAITAHTQNSGELTEQDMYMSMLYAAAHDVAGYSWFCYFPLSGELQASIAGYDGNYKGDGYGNGIGNTNNDQRSFYNVAKTASEQFEFIQGILDGYNLTGRSDSNNVLTTTLSNGTKTATVYVNSDTVNVSETVSCTLTSGKEYYLIGYDVGCQKKTSDGNSISIAPGQAVLYIA